MATLPSASMSSLVGEEPGSQLRAFPSGQRRGVQPERHRQARLVHVQGLEHHRVVEVGKGLPDHDLGDPDDRRLGHLP